MPYILETPDGLPMEFKDEIPVEVAQELLKRHYGGDPQTNAFRDVPSSLLSGIGSLVELPGTLYGLAGGDPDNIVSRAGSGIRDFARDTLASEGYREQRADVEDRLAELEGQNLTKQISGTLGELATNPYFLFNMGVEQIPQLAGGIKIGQIAKNAVIKRSQEAGQKLSA